MTSGAGIIMASTISTIITILIYMPIDKKFGISAAINEHILQGINVNPLIVLLSFVAVATVGTGTLLELVSISTMVTQLIYGVIYGLGLGVVIGLYRLRGNQ